MAVEADEVGHAVKPCVLQEAIATSEHWRTAKTPYPQATEFMPAHDVLALFRHWNGGGTLQDCDVTSSNSIIEKISRGIHNKTYGQWRLIVNNLDSFQSRFLKL